MNGRTERGLIKRRRRCARRAAESSVAERLAAWMAPDGTVLPPPRFLVPAGHLAGVRAQPCPSCAAPRGRPCLNDEGTGTAEHGSRVALALRAAGHDDLATSAAFREGGVALVMTGGPE